MQSMIKVTIATGRVLENNLHAFWDGQWPAKEQPGPAGRPNPALQSRSLSQVSALQLNGGRGQALLDRVKEFNGSWQRRNYKHAWSDTDILQLAVLMGLQSRKSQYAAARLARSPRACRMMFTRIKKAGVI